MNNIKQVFSTSEAAFAVDRNGQVMAWNQAAEQTMGYAESEALGQQCWELLSGRDVFGNQSCCEGCPILVTAFNDESINRFQIDFKTQKQDRKRFTICTLMLFNDPGKEVLVHLCHPESDTDKPATKHAVANKKNDTLTARETEVLTLLHKGMTVAEIANALNICASTVRSHIQHILCKLNVKSRFEAVALGRKLSFI
ncbi:MAG: LuxR C-terminal-related transcriptional regulator [Xanthomonadales bacterium]|nr:LuxR C-terminal-related transcriptional regulator [Xanthomonadales bacterium]